MKLELDVHGAGASQAIPINYENTDRVDELIARIDEQARIDGASILTLALDSDAPLDQSQLVKDLKLKHTALKVHRVCVEVHFESEQARHNFPVSARWARVHRWACRHFTVSHDACANLELRAGAQDGPALNERKEIGASDDCRVVWLVKPGAEPNGAGDGSP